MPSYYMPNLHGYSVKFSPFSVHRFALVSNENFGIVGNGVLGILEIVNNNIIVKNQSIKWSNGLFDLEWNHFVKDIIVTGSGDGSLQIWNISNVSTPVVIFKEHETEVSSLDWKFISLLSSSWDGTIKLWDTENSNKSLLTYKIYNNVHQVVWCPYNSSNFASVSQDGQLRIWDSHMSVPSVQCDVYTSDILTCSWSPFNNNIIATGGTDCIIKIWDLRNTKSCSSQLTGCTDPIKKIQFSPHCDLIGSISYDLSTSIWDYNLEETQVETFKQHSEFIYGFQFNIFNKGQFIDCGWDCMIHVKYSKLIRNKI